MELACISRLQLQGNNSNITQCQQMNLKHLGLNSRYTFTVAGISIKSLWVNDYQKSVIRADHARGEAFYHGELLSFIQTEKNEREFHFHLQFGCSLHRLDNGAHHHLYINQTLEEIIKSLLLEYKIDAEFHLALNIRLPYTAQGGVSDYDFLWRLCVDHGLIFYFQHTETNVRLIFTDDTYPDNQHRLLFNPANGMVNNTATITALQYRRMCLPDNVRLRGAPEGEPSQLFVTITDNATDLPGYGLINLSHQYPLYSQADCDKHAHCLQQQLDSQREWLQIEVQGVALQAGDSVLIEGHPHLRCNGLFRVVEVSGSLDEKKHGEGGHLFNQQAFLIPALLHYRMPSASTQIAWNHALYGETPSSWRNLLNQPQPALQIAVIQGETGTVTIDEQGRYYVKPLFDKAERAFGKTSNPVRQLQTAVGPQNQIGSQGMHFPLIPKTRVILAHLHDQVDMPFILGVLPGHEQMSPVLSDNHAQLVLRHRYGSALVFDDSEHQQITSLQTANKKHGLFLQKQNNHEQISVNSIGSMHFECGQEMVVTSQNLNLKCDAYQLKADEELNLITDKGSMDWHAENAITYWSGHDWRSYTSEGTLAADSCQLFTAAGKTVSFQSNGMTIKSSHGEVHAPSSFTMQAKNSLALGVGGSSFLMNGGSIGLKSPQISLQTLLIIKNQSASMGG